MANNKKNEMLWSIIQYTYCIMLQNMKYLHYIYIYIFFENIIDHHENSIIVFLYIYKKIKKKIKIHIHFLLKIFN